MVREMKRKTVFVIMLLVFWGATTAISDSNSFTQSVYEEIQSAEGDGMLEGGVLRKKNETALSNSYFSASLPEGWKQEVRRDANSEVFLLELKKITGAKIPVLIYLRFYPNNSDFSNYQDFIERNSKNIFGETSTSKEKYGPVKKITLNGRDAFYLTKDYKHSLHLNKKSDESVNIKNINIVIPSSNGFYVLTYRSSESDTDEYFSVFNKIVKSFKPLKAVKGVKSKAPVKAGKE